MVTPKPTPTNPTPAVDSDPTRWSLIGRLKDMGDDASWQTFFDSYWRLIFATAVRSGLTESEAQEVVQETVISVAKRIPGFELGPASGSFKGWLLTITRRRIVDALRRRPPAERMLQRGLNPHEDTTTIQRLPDTAAPTMDEVWEQEWQRQLLEAALERVKGTTSSRQFQIFHLAVIRELPVREVCAALKVGAAQVYLAKFRITALVRKEVARLQRGGE